MKTAVHIDDGVVRAPCSGVLAFEPPCELAGELEIYRRGDVLATVGGLSLRAPFDGFVLRRCAREGDIGEGAAVLVFKEA
jgi:hypothetical protein